MTSRLVYRTAIAIILAAGFAFVAGRWTAPKPPRPTGCPYAPCCPYCQGQDAFHQGQDLSANPYPAELGDAHDRSSARHRWLAGWMEGKFQGQPYTGE
jgi:hypothetical protein